MALAAAARGLKFPAFALNRNRVPRY